MRRVVITGVGIVSSLGTGYEKVASALKSGRSGIRFLPERMELGFRSGLSGVIDDFECPPELSRKQKKTMTDYGIQAYAASVEAVKMAGWTEEEVCSSQTGIIIGNDSSGLANVEQVEILKREKSTFPIGASLVFQSLTSTVSMNLNVLFRNRGASWTISSACSSGAHAVGQAADLIASGRQDRIISGGVQEINWESVCSFDATNAFSVRHDAPHMASRPFDSGRDGLIPSGGAAIVALEDYDLAMKRGADILGEVLAYSFSSDGSSLNVPSGDGLRSAMEDCVKRASVIVDRIDYVCAHATSTPIGDLAEARAIRGFFGGQTPWVSSVKSMTGHEMWMAGASQVVYSVIMGREKFIAPNINFKSQEENAPKLRIASETIDMKPGVILVNSAGFGGTNACLLLRMSHHEI